MSKDKKHKPYQVYNVQGTTNYFIRKNDIPLAMVYNEKMANRIAKLLNMFSGGNIMNMRKAIMVIAEKDATIRELKKEMKDRIDVLSKRFDKEVVICNKKRHDLDVQLAESFEKILAQKRTIIGLITLTISLIVVLILNFVISLF